MDKQTAFLQLFGQIRIIDLLIFILAAGYIIPQLKKLYMWPGCEQPKTENRPSAMLKNWEITTSRVSRSETVCRSR